MAIQAKNFNKVNKFTINVQNFLLANTTLIDAKIALSFPWNCESDSKSDVETTKKEEYVKRNQGEQQRKQEQHRRKFVQRWEKNRQNLE